MMISKCNVEVGLQSALTKIGILVLQSKSCMTIFDYFNNYYGTKDSIFNSGSNCTFNPLDKVVELYERLLAAEKVKNAYL